MATGFSVRDGHVGYQFFMKKLLSIFGLFLAVSAQAVTFSDADTFPEGAGAGLLAGGVINGSFDFRAVPVPADTTTSFAIGAPYLPVQFRDTYSSSLGLDPATMSVVPNSGSVSFFFRDPVEGGAPNLVTIAIPADASLSGPATFENFLILNKSTTALLEGSIGANGFFNYTITNTGTSAFFVDGAFATIDAIPRGVPDGGSAVALLGVALVGLEGFRRKVQIS